MRSTVYDAATSFDSDEQLTTGEAAALLNSTRQHVADLCDRGDLPFTLVGRHRRVRRGDIEAIRTRNERMSRDQRRSLWLAYATVGKITVDPDGAIARARRNLERMATGTRGEARRWLEEWEMLLDGPIEKLLDIYTARSLRGRELRQNSPFAGLLTEQERSAALQAWQAEASR